MKSFSLCLSLLLASQAYAAPADHRSEAHITETELTGGPHGKYFDDRAVIGNDHKRISIIKMTGGCDGPNAKYPERVDQLQLTYRNNYMTSSTDFVSHGGTEGSKSTEELKLETDEFVKEVLVGDYSQKVGKFIGSTWTRVGYLKFTTNKDRTIECGDVKKTETLHTLAPKEKSALLYFSGNQGAMIDRLNAHWIPAENF